MTIDFTQVKSDVTGAIGIVVGWLLGIVTFAWRISARITKIEVLLNESAKDILALQKKIDDHDAWERAMMLKEMERRGGSYKLHDSTEG